MSQALRLVIVDPSPLARARIGQRLAGFSDLVVLPLAADLSAAWRSTEEQEPDLVILPADMARVPEFATMKSLFFAVGALWLVTCTPGTAERWWGPTLNPTLDHDAILAGHAQAFRLRGSQQRSDWRRWRRHAPGDVTASGKADLDGTWLSGHGPPALSSAMGTAVRLWGPERPVDPGGKVHDRGARDDTPPRPDTVSWRPDGSFGSSAVTAVNAAAAVAPVPMIGPGRQPAPLATSGIGRQSLPDMTFAKPAARSRGLQDGTGDQHAHPGSATQHGSAGPSQPGRPGRGPPTGAESPAPPALPGDRGDRHRLVLIGASTGGVDALVEVISRFPADGPPTAIVQHTGRGFSDSLVRLLARRSRAHVVAASHGLILSPGTVAVAAGLNGHLRLLPGQQIRCAITPGEPVSGHIPSVDVLFMSALPMADRVVAAILTGMGRDGADGLLALRRAGAQTFGQDAVTSVVYGMPRVAHDIGAVGRQVALQDMGVELLSAATQPYGGDALVRPGPAGRPKDQDKGDK